MELEPLRRYRKFYCIDRFHGAPPYVRHSRANFQSSSNALLSIYRVIKFTINARASRKNFQKVSRRTVIITSARIRHDECPSPFECSRSVQRCVTSIVENRSAFKIGFTPEEYLERDNLHAFFTARSSQS